MGNCCCCCKDRVTGPELSEDSAVNVNLRAAEQRELDGLSGVALSEYADKCVLDTLAVIQTLVDNDQEPPMSMVKLHTIADRETGWLVVVWSMVRVVPLGEPLGPAVITLLLDDCPLPSKETILQLVTFLDLGPELADSCSAAPQLHRNICVVLGSLAEKLAGPVAVALLTDCTLAYLVACLRETNPVSVILFALIALEKFAQTSENKHAVRKYLEKLSENPLRHLETWVDETDFLACQVGFCAQWCLDNLFLSEDRAFAFEHVDTSSVNAMLNANDVSEYLKISPDGLQARCDASSFESVRCTFQAEEGVWYYEATVDTAGVMQIGWATKDSKFLNHEGYGIGDDEFSVAYDGCRQLLWHNAHSESHNHPCWKPGDILGTLLDLENGNVVFYLNGQSLPALHSVFENAKGGFFAAASFMSFQQCRFNFGKKPFQFPPLELPTAFQSFNDHGVLSDEERVILPRHLRLLKCREVSLEEGACTLCFDRPVSVMLLPCHHQGFCDQCSLLLEICPMCRSVILERVPTVSSRPQSVDSRKSKSDSTVM